MASDYPGGIDAFDTIASDKKTSDAVGGRTHRAMHNDLGDAIESIEGELGVNPAGIYDTVAERLAAVDDRVLDGTISDIDIAADADIDRSKIAGTALTTSSTSVFSVLDYGAVGDGVTDDTVAIQAALDATKAQNGTATFQRGRVYKVTAAILVELGANEAITIEGNDATIVYDADAPAGITKVLEITDDSTTNLTGATVTIRGLNFDGSGVDEQWPVDESPDRTEAQVYAEVKQLWMLTLRADTIVLDDLAFDNIYGYGIKIRSFQDARITNITTENVGGSWWTNTTYDAYGDSIYVGGGKQTGNRVVVDNAKLVGYPDDRIRKSRAGLVFETNVEFVEVGMVYVEGYNRNIHIEGCASIVATIRSVKSRRADLHLYVHTGFKTIRISGWDVEADSGGGYGGLNGLLGLSTIADTTRLLEISNGDFLIHNDVATSFSTERVSFVDCNFVADGGRQQISGGYIVTKNCRFVGKVLRVYAGELEALNGVTLGVDTNPVIEVQYASSRGRLIWIGGEMKDSRIHLINVPYAIFENFVAIETLNFLYSGVCAFISDFGSSIFVKKATLKTTTNDSAVLSYAASRTTYLGDSYRINSAGVASAITSSV